MPLESIMRGRPIQARKRKGTRSVSGVAERVAFACACCRSETVRPQRRLYAPWKWRIPSSACPGGGRQSSRRGAAFGLHPFRRGTRRAFRCGRTLCTFFSAPSTPRLGSGTPCAAIGFRRKASCRASLDARRGTRRADRTDVRPPGLRAQPGAGIARRCERADGRAPGWRSQPAQDKPFDRPVQ